MLFTPLLYDVLSIDVRCKPSIKSLWSCRSPDCSWRSRWSLESLPPSVTGAHHPLNNYSNSPSAVRLCPPLTEAKDWQPATAASGSRCQFLSRDCCWRHSLRSLGDLSTMSFKTSAPWQPPENPSGIPAPDAAPKPGWFPRLGDLWRSTGHGQSPAVSSAASYRPQRRCPR
jgi:hypothetical protein